MYINITNLFKLKNPLMLPLLLVLKQATKKDVSEQLALLIDDDELDHLIKNNFVKYIKGTKGQNDLQKLRLDKKGTEFLNLLDEPEVEDEDIKIFEWLSAIYKKREKQIGNGKKTKRHIASFREKSGIDKNNLAFLCNQFINDDNEQEYSHKLEFVFFKPDNAFQVRFVLESSRLYQYYMNKKAYFDNQFKNLK